MLSPDRVVSSADGRVDSEAEPGSDWPLQLGVIPARSQSSGAAGAVARASQVELTSTQTNRQRSVEKRFSADPQSCPQTLTPS